MIPGFSGLTLITAPVVDPITVADAKAHSRIFSDAESSLIAGYIRAATIGLEDHTKRAFMPQKWRLALKHFPGRKPGLGYLEANVQEYYKWNRFELPKPPLVSIDSFIYTDSGGTDHAMTQGFGNQVGNYLLDLEPEPGMIVLPFAGIWPTTILLPGSPIKISYTCGYPSASVFGFSGECDLASTGVATWVSGDKFDPMLVGTWLTLSLPAPQPEEGSFNVSAFLDDQHLQLRLQDPLPMEIPTAPDEHLTFVGNSVPMPIRSAILYLAAHFYENREPIVTGRSESAIEIPKTIDAQLSHYMIRST